ncbi:MAG: hypothetical protein ACJAU6_000534 [Alphaproteobacteria bacterium]|jgi:hypothetical protein
MFLIKISVFSENFETDERFHNSQEAWILDGALRVRGVGIK